LRRIGDDDAADRFEDMTAAEYAEHKGAELLDNPHRRTVMARVSKSKADLQTELEEANDYIEELESKLDHIAGIAADEAAEEDGKPENLSWNCRRCNTTIGVVMTRAGLGRRTHQVNPTGQGARSLGQWLTAVLSMKGESSAMTVPAAVEMIRATPPARRSAYG